MFIVILRQPGKLTAYLRGTVWSTEPTRAYEFATMEQAQAAIDKAVKFLPSKSLAKHITIEKRIA